MVLMKVMLNRQLSRNGDLMISIPALSLTIFRERSESSLRWRSAHHCHVSGGKCQSKVGDNNAGNEDGFFGCVHGSDGSSRFLTVQEANQENLGEQNFIGKSQSFTGFHGSVFTSFGMS